MNIDNIKSQFPIFSKKINGKKLVYLDSANSAQKPIAVIKRLDDFYKNEFSNIGRSIHSLAVNATNKFDETRELVKDFINADSKEEVIFTKNATESINLVASSFGKHNIKKGFRQGLEWLCYCDSRNKKCLWRSCNIKLP